MKGDAKVIEFLNQALKNELTAINQYFLHSRILKDWGVSELAKKEHDESIEEMHHAEWLIQRIIFFEGMPIVTKLNSLKIGQSVLAIVTTDQASELDAIQAYNAAMRLAQELEQLNRRRQDLEAEIMREAVAALGDGEVPSAIVLASRGWHLGVVGIGAARLMERYHRPAIVMAINEQGIGKGSARTIPGFDLYQALASCKDLLVAFGGHPSAAGMTIHESQLPEFQARFAAVAGAWSSAGNVVPTLHLDSEVSLTDVNMRLIQEIGSLHPFGAGNPEPMFAVKGLAIMEARVVGEKHLKMTVRQGRSLPFDSIGFGIKSLAEQGLRQNQPVDLAFTPEINHWNGLDRIQLRIKDMRATATE